MGGVESGRRGCAAGGIRDGRRYMNTEYRIQNTEEGCREQKRRLKPDSVEMGNAVVSESINPVKTGVIFDKSEWLTTKEAAIYLRKIAPNGMPSVSAIHKLVERGAIRRRKFGGKLLFLRKELNYLIESTVV